MTNGEKFAAATTLLAFHESIFVHLDPSVKGVTVPLHLQSNKTVALQFGHNLLPAIPDLRISEEGIFGTLSFGGRPYFVAVPWPAVWAIVDPNGNGSQWGYGGPIADVLNFERASKIVERGRGRKPRPFTERPAWLKVIDGGKSRRAS